MYPFFNRAPQNKNSRGVFEYRCLKKGWSPFSSQKSFADVEYQTEC